MAKKVGYANYRFSPLKKITARAKALRKAKPSMPWTDAIKKASAEHNIGKKVSGHKKVTVKKTVTKKIIGKKIAGHKKQSAKPTTGASNIHKISSTGSELNRLSLHIKKLQESKKGKTVKERNAITREITIAKKQFQSLKKYFNSLATFTHTR